MKRKSHKQKNIYIGKSIAEEYKISKPGGSSAFELVEGGGGSNGVFDWNIMHHRLPDLLPVHRQCEKSVGLGLR